MTLLAMASMARGGGEHPELLGPTLGTMGEGGDFGAAARAWVHPRVLLRGYLEKHTASVSSAATRYDIAPWNAGVGATYFFPTAGRLRLGAGLAVGITSIRGKFEGPRFSLNARGSGPDVRATGEAMWPLGRDWFASGTAGWRYARVDNIILSKQSTNTPAEFSGFILRLAIGREWPRAKNP